MAFREPQPRIQYNGINIDFDAVSSWKNVPMKKRSSIEAESGIKEHLLSYQKERLSAILDFQDAQKIINELRQFYQFMMDDSTATFKAWRDRQLGGYFPFEGKTLYNNDRVNGTYTQALSSSAMNNSYLDPSTGLLTFVANTANTPRFPAGKFGHGILIEGSRKNELNTDFSTWTASNVTVAATTAETKDPEGGVGAAKLTATSAQGTVTFTTAVVIAAQDAVTSIFLKSSGGTTDIRLAIRGSTSGNHSSGQLLVPTNGQDGNGFTRYQLNWENGVDTALVGNLEVQITIFDNGATVFAYIPQLEQGADIMGASSVIKGNALTRSAASLVYAATNIINRTRGSISMWFKPQWSYAKHPFACLFHSGVDTTNRHISFGITNSGTWEVRLYHGNSTNFIQISPSASEITQDAWNYIVMTYDSLLISNIVKFYVNGALAAQGGSGAGDASSVGTSFGLGCFNTGGSPAYAVIDDFMAYSEPLTAGEGKYIYELGTALALERSYF